MAVVRNKFTSGSNGDSVTTGNTGASAVAFNGTNTGVISTAQSWSATRSVLVTCSATTTGSGYWSVTGISSSSLGADKYIYVTAYPNAEQGILGFFTGTSTRAVSLNLTTTGQLRIRDAAGGGGANIYTSTGVVPLNTWTRVSMFATPNATTGTIRCAAYLGSSSSAIANTDSTLLTARNTGAANYDAIRWGGKIGTGTTTITLYIDDYAYDTSAAGLLAPESATPPSLPATPDEDYYVFIDMSSTVFAGGGGGTFTATPSTNVVGTSTGVFVPAPADGSDATFNVVATDAVNGASDDMDVTIALPVSTQDVIETVVWNGSAWV